MGAIWEPFKPEVGERVRIRVGWENPKLLPAIGHELVDGATGTVVGIWECEPEEFPGYRYRVRLDRPIRALGQVKWHRHCAAVELERLGDGTDAEKGG